MQPDQVELLDATIEFARQGLKTGGEIHPFRAELGDGGIRVVALGDPLAGVGEVARAVECLTRVARRSAGRRSLRAWCTCWDSASQGAERLRYPKSLHVSLEDASGARLNLAVPYALPPGGEFEFGPRREVHER